MGTTPDDRRLHATSRVFVAILVAACLVVGGLAVVDLAGANEAEEANISVDRDDQDLLVNLSDYEDDADRVDVTNPNVGMNESESVDNDTATFDLSTAVDPEMVNDSLTDSNVEIAVNNESYESDVSLHTVAFDDDLPVWIDDDDRMVVPLDQNETIGVTDEDELTVAASGAEETTFDGSVRANESQLTFPLSSLDDVGTSETVTLDVQADGGSVTPADGHLEIGPELRTIRDAPTLWYPLIEVDEEYDVVFETDGQYVDNVSPTAPGELDASPADPQGTLNATVTEVGSDEPLVDGDVPIRDTLEVNATVEEDTGTVAIRTEDGELQRGLHGLPVEDAVIISSDVRYVEVDATVDEGTLDFDNETVAAGDELLLGTAAGLVSISELEEPADDEEDEADEEPDDPGLLGLPSLPDVGSVGVFAALVFVPVLLGGVVGAGTGRLLPLEKRTGLALSVGASIVLAILTTGLILSVSASLLSPGWEHGVGIAGILLGGITAGGTTALFGDGRGSTPKFSASVTITDGSRRLTGQTTVYYRRSGTDSPQSTTLTDGQGTITLPGAGEWELVAKHGEHKSNVATVHEGSPNARLTVSIPDASVTVVDGSDRRPVPGAAVRRMDDSNSTRTNRSGVVTLDPPADGSSVEIEVSHEKYYDETATVDFSGNAHTVSLDPKVGSARIVSRIDGAAAASMPVRVEPTERFLRDRSQGGTERTGSDGVVTMDRLLVGKYRATASVPNDRESLFDVRDTTVVVREGERTTAEIDLHFNWSLSRDHQNRIDELRQDVRALGTHSGRDTTIPEYYGSVVESILDEAEALPDAGHLFVRSNADPDDVASAMISAASNLMDAITGAMTTKRNVDLFAACADMQTSNVRWSGSCDLEDVLERLETDPMTQRNDAKDRYKRASDHVERKRRDVSEVAPAQEMLERTWKVVNETRRGEEAILTAYAAALMFEAVEEVFEHRVLKERLSRTVF